MFGLGTPELIVIGVVVFLLFGAKRIPEIGKGLGGAIREFRDARKDISSGSDAAGQTKRENPEQQASVESRLAKKMGDRIPGVKQTMVLKEKVDKLKEITKS